MQRAKENFNWFAGKVSSLFFSISPTCNNDMKASSGEYDDCDNPLKAVLAEAPLDVKESALKLAAEMLKRLEGNPANCVPSKKILGEVLLRIRTIDVKNPDVAAAAIKNDLKLIDMNIMQVAESEENKELRAAAIELVKIAQEVLGKLETKKIDIVTPNVKTAPQP